MQAKLQEGSIKRYECCKMWSAGCVCVAMQLMRSGGTSEHLVRGNAEG